MRHLKKFENFIPEELLVGQVWFGGYYEYEYGPDDYKKSDRYYVVVTEIEEEFEIIKFRVLSGRNKGFENSDVLSSFIDRFEYICESEDQLDAAVKGKKYNL